MFIFLRAKADTAFSAS